MLTVTIQGDELWDDDLEQFCYTEDVVLHFEHSLVSLSKWEAEFHKPFLTPDKKSEEEMFGYVRAMLMTPGVPASELNRLSETDLTAINDYINNPMTGSTVAELPQPPGPKQTERISAELIYFWMNHYRIDYDARNWHLNQLFTLVKIHHAKNQKPKKMSTAANRQSMAELNAQRKARMGTTG